ncbi:TPA: hypothetical protein H1016_00035 [archaeon]|uniref:HTH marR-type domain-containing protein n=1 Tax=Candidatus Naiadarchaeum limnaeum TaxID=2756139 RepID=A0A832X5M1_9ARCH|nr:hypothetical protein [Candidatus Naiadarchaeum limnaeum]
MNARIGRRLLALTFLALLLAAPQAVKAATADYNIVVNDAGDSLVVLNIVGSGEIRIPLPLDVSNPEVRGALYVPAENGIDILIGPSGKASVAYDTSLLTAKSGGTWVFDLDLVKWMDKKVTVLLPPHAEITSTTPRGAIEQLSDSKKVTWNVDQYAEKVSATYTLAERATLKPALISPILLGILAVVFVGIIALAYARPGLLPKQKVEKRRFIQRPAVIERKSLITKEKQNVLKTLTENELKIVNNLLTNSGSMKRNKLEREAQIAKSSLASALATLERRNVVQIDRTYTVHTVELSDWFRKL